MNLLTFFSNGCLESFNLDVAENLEVRYHHEDPKDKNYEGWSEGLRWSVKIWFVSQSIMTCYLTDEEVIDLIKKLGG